jgi:hypothetical protein
MLRLVKRWVLAMLTPYRTALRLAALPATSGAFDQSYTWRKGRSREDEEVANLQRAVLRRTRKWPSRGAWGRQSLQTGLSCHREGKGETSFATTSEPDTLLSSAAMSFRTAMSRHPPIVQQRRPHYPQPHVLLRSPAGVAQGTGGSAGSGRVRPRMGRHRARSAAADRNRGRARTRWHTRPLSPRTKRRSSAAPVRCGRNRPASICQNYFTTSQP